LSIFGYAVAGSASNAIAITVIPTAIFMLKYECCDAKLCNEAIVITIFSPQFYLG
jgi:hypothetical protein